MVSYSWRGQQPTGIDTNHYKNSVTNGMFVGCLTSLQQASVSQGRICSDNSTCCHIEIEVADQTFYLTQSQYTDTGPTSPSAEPITPGAWQDNHWSANFEVTGMTGPRKNPGASGIRTRDLPLSRRTPYHWANEAVCKWKQSIVKSKKPLQWERRPGNPSHNREPEVRCPARRMLVNARK